MRTVASLSALLLLTACGSTPAPAPAWRRTETAAPALPPGTTLYVGPVFYDPQRGPSPGLLVDGAGVIVRAWDADQPVPDVPQTVLAGTFAVPGLHDAHLHVEGIGRRAETVQLLGAGSPQEVNRKVAAFAAAHPDVPVIYGRGWDQSLFDGQAFPTAADLTAAPDRPVVLSRVDGHAIWVNALALERAGFAAAAIPDIDGGEILRDTAGVPTGILVDNAEETFKAALAEKLPPTSDEDRARWLQNGLQACADAGLVAVHDMGMSPESFAVLQQMDAKTLLPARVFVYLDGTQEASYPLLATPPGRRVAVRGVKLYADGAMGSRGAALLAPYSDRPDHRGSMVTEPKLLEERARRAHQAGKQVAIHAIGDRGVREALSAIGGAEADARTVRHRVEHAQLVDPDDFAGFVTLGVIASMQPTHATSDMRWAEQRVGPDRIQTAYAWRTMLDNKIPLAFGSDAPVESERVLGGLFAAVTRTDAQGEPPGGWRPAQRVSLDEALRAFSAGAAFAVHREQDLGGFGPGQRFDASVFSHDLRHDDVWDVVAVRGTVVDGQWRAAAPAGPPGP